VQDEYIQKPTAIVSSCDRVINEMSKVCMKDHAHTVCEGAKTRGSENYPWAMARAIASAIMGQQPAPHEDETEDLKIGEKGGYTVSLAAANLKCVRYERDVPEAEGECQSSWKNQAGRATALWADGYEFETPFGFHWAVPPKPPTAARLRRRPGRLRLLAKRPSKRVAAQKKPRGNDELAAEKPSKGKAAPRAKGQAHDTAEKPSEGKAAPRARGQAHDAAEKPSEGKAAPRAKGQVKTESPLEAVRDQLKIEAARREEKIVTSDGLNVKVSAEKRGEGAWVLCLKVGARQVLSWRECSARLAGQSPRQAAAALWALACELGGADSASVDKERLLARLPKPAAGAASAS
jgi:hypothetical protein